MKIWKKQFYIGGLHTHEYSRIHRVIRKKYGNANKCENPSCIGLSKKFDWALKKDRTYSEEIEDYLQLCKSCHIHYDYKADRGIKQSKIRKNIIWHNRMRIVARFCEDDMQLYSSIANAARDNGMLINSIQNCLVGRAQTSGGFIWKYRDGK